MVPPRGCGRFPVDAVVSPEMPRPRIGVKIKRLARVASAASDPVSGSRLIAISRNAVSEGSESGDKQIEGSAIR